MVVSESLNTILEGRDATVLIVFMELKCNYKAMSSTIIPLVPSSFALRYISIMRSVSAVVALLKVYSEGDSMVVFRDSETTMNNKN